MNDVLAAVDEGDVALALAVFVLVALDFVLFVFERVC
jgi:hypothetical protein